MVSPNAVEVAKTVLEVADVAWTAVECSHHLRHHGNSHSSSDESDANLESLRSENRRLRSLLEKNLVLLYKLSQSPSFLNDCPPDLQARLVDTVRSDDYLTRLKCLQQNCTEGGNEFPFKEATDIDYQSADILINVDSEQPSWWVWVKDEVEPSNVEEWSGIDNENYVVIGEEHVVDGVANFMAKCILSNPKARNLSPEELRKTLLKAIFCNELSPFPLL
ncbi:uncharacterized protein LOC114731912 isoform X2 [Neltuma alba]|uniref:uncharacterized protein LOC114731912 isoform X2 n=1 Tax=Neltuma alba TaxID=207710 RepID=UPI0010A54995|nr:uncharacterized protein LOC114731912 isoform X2 [Prosopis alba]